MEQFKMQIEIEVESEAVTTKEFPSKKNPSEKIKIHEQTVYVHANGHKYPFEARISLPKARNGAPFQKGRHIVPIEVYADAYGSLSASPMLSKAVPAQPIKKAA